MGSRAQFWTGHIFWNLRHIRTSCQTVLPASIRGWLTECLTECCWSHMMHCSCPSQSSGCYFTSGWAHTCRRLARPGLPRHLRSCTVCSSGALGDQWYRVFDCPLYNGLQLSFARLYSDAQWSLAWHKDQNRVCELSQCWLNGGIESLSLSLSIGHCHSVEEEEEIHYVHTASKGL